MKFYLNGILVVEGKEDQAYLSNYICSEIVVVNGFELSESILAYLKDKHVIALLDPDEAGAKIRDSLNNKLKNVSNVFIDISKCTPGTKNGVAECEINEVLSKLQPFFINKNETVSDIKKSDLYNLDLLSNKLKREYVCRRLNLGKCNGKILYKRLVLNNIQLDILCKIVKEYNNNGN